MVELTQSATFGMVWAISQRNLADLSVEIDGDGFAGISEFRDYLVAGHRHHVASVQGSATVTLKAAGQVVATASFESR